MHSSRAIFESPKKAGRFIVRVSFGLALIFIGINHFMTMADYQAMVSSNLGPLTILGQIWAYVIPALMVIGGLSFVSGYFPIVGAWAGGVALGSIPAGVMLKTVIGGASLGDMMPQAITAYIWLIVFVFALKGFRRGCCCGANCESGSGCNDNCGCTPGAKH